VDGFEYFRYGSFFGECLGYCQTEIKIERESIQKKSKGWNQYDELPKTERIEIVNSIYFEELTRYLDFNKFKKLDEVLGCPDCADGGGEWVEIRRNGQTSKVTFEYGNAPEELSNIIGLLRAYASSFNAASREPTKFNDRVLINQTGEIKNFICTRGCSQYLIKLNNHTSNEFFYPQYLESEFLKDGLAVSFHAVIMLEETAISKPSPTDQPVFDFNAQNIRLFGIKAL
jgi:hypothetical protein